MKPPRFEYHRPASVAEAVEIKARYGEDAAVLAGGQSLMPLLNMRFARPRALIDLNRVAELAYVRRGADGLAIGAMTRQRAVERDRDAARCCPLLHEALAHVGHAVIRNRGTVGGSIAHADPAAELPATLVALGGHVVATGPGGTRRIPASQLFRSHFTTALMPDEALTEVFLPAARAGTGHAFMEVTRRHGDFALAGVAAVVAGGEPTLVFSGVGPHPVAVATDDPDVAAAEVEPTGDLHGSEGYRRELVRVLTTRALAVARRRAAEATRP